MSEIPDAIIFKVPANAVPSKRKTITVAPSSGYTYDSDSGSNVINIHLPGGQGFMDTECSYLKFDLKLTCKDGTTDLKSRFFGAASVIQRLDITTADGNTGETIDYYADLNMLMHQILVSQDNFNTSFAVLQGTSDLTTATTGLPYDPAAAPAAPSPYLNGTHQFIVPFVLSGLWKNNKYIPLQKFRNGINIQIMLSPAYKVVQIEAAPSGFVRKYVLSNVEMVCDIIEFDNAVTSEMMKMLQEEGLKIAYQTFVSNSSALTGNNNTIVIQNNSKSIRDLYTVLIDNTARTATSIKNPYIFGYYDMISAQLRNGTNSYPMKPLDCKNGATQVYAELLKSFNCLTKVFGTFISRTNWTTSHYALGFSLEAHPSNSEYLYSGINTQESAAPLELNIVTGLALSNVTALSFIHRDQILTIQPDMSTTVAY